MNIMRWFLFGVFIVVVPPLFNGWYRIILGKSVESYENELKKLNAKKDIIDIAVGYGQTLFLHKDGSVSTFGFNDYAIKFVI